MNEKEQFSRPLIMSTQYHLPFLQLDPHRFEYLCLRVAKEKYGLKNLEHTGRTGADAGADILGQNEKNEAVAIQCKRCEKFSGKDPVQALEQFCKENSNFNGQFWIMTAGSVSKKARDRFKAMAKKKNLEAFIIDGSSLEADVRSEPSLMAEFFSTPSVPVPTDQPHHSAASSAIKILQRFEDKFLNELDRSFWGNFLLIRERQQVLGRILTDAMLDLKAEMAVLPDRIDGPADLEKIGNRIISNYKLSGETSVEGLPVYGATKSVLALSDMSDDRIKLKEVCEKLRIQIKGYLL